MWNDSTSSKTGRGKEEYEILLGVTLLFTLSVLSLGLAKYQTDKIYSLAFVGITPASWRYDWAWTALVIGCCFLILSMLILTIFINHTYRNSIGLGNVFTGLIFIVFAFMQLVQNVRFSPMGAINNAAQFKIEVLNVITFTLVISGTILMASRNRWTAILLIPELILSSRQFAFYGYFWDLSWPHIFSIFLILLSIVTLFSNYILLRHIKYKQSQIQESDSNLGNKKTSKDEITSFSEFFGLYRLLLIIGVITIVIFLLFFIVVFLIYVMVIFYQAYHLRDQLTS